MKRLILMGLVVFTVAGCVDRDVMGVNDEVAVLEQTPEFHIARGADHLKIMSQNLYFGAPVEPIIAATDPIAAAIAVAEAWEIMVHTDFPTRATALAAEIAKANPHLIGLQEVAIYRTEPIFDPTQEATDVFQDFLEILLAALENRYPSRMGRGHRNRRRKGFPLRQHTPRVRGSAGPARHSHGAGIRTHPGADGGNAPAHHRRGLQLGTWPASVGGRVSGI
jgi:hypothetical protein